MTCNCVGGNPCPCQRGQIVGSIVFGPGDQKTLPELLENARTRVMTPKERYEQTVSWLMGMSGKLSDPMPSRERIVKALEDMGVYDPDRIAAPSTGSAKK